MAEAAKPAAEHAEHANSAGPAPAAAAAPCECTDRLNTLEGRMSAYEGVNRALSYLMLAAAAAVIYIMWTGGPGSGTGAKK